MDEEDLPRTNLSHLLHFAPPRSSRQASLDGCTSSAALVDFYAGSQRIASGLPPRTANPPSAAEHTIDYASQYHPNPFVAGAVAHGMIPSTTRDC